ncbi:hypothetical protein L484_027175 [Morus notabilis]|uniref:Pyrrolo-quinoline quinone repeat domain-containing protein n=1 Tax=Morus notabilis TaxID=981085 RepID=W9SQB1_9ROSA|nr:hypothetical protein L484_027175 [Morus notabilis]
MNPTSATFGPGSLEGGGIWGAATDGKRVYTNIVNANRKPLVPAPTNPTATSGGWMALDADTGRILWVTADPAKDTAHGSVTVANGVVLIGSVAPDGLVYAIDGETGKILWSANTGATVYGGPSVGYGCVFIGSGYSVSSDVCDEKFQGFNNFKYQKTKRNRSEAF